MCDAYISFLCERANSQTWISKRMTSQNHEELQSKLLRHTIANRTNFHLEKEIPYGFISHFHLYKLVLTKYQLSLHCIWVANANKILSYRKCAILCIWMTPISILSVWLFTFYCKCSPTLGIFANMSCLNKKRIEGSMRRRRWEANKTGKNQFLYSCLADCILKAFCEIGFSTTYYS